MDIKDHYPFKSRYLEINGHRLHYVDEGRGDVIVMLHGNPTWSFLYRHLIKSLSSSFRVIVPDHIGCGLSEKPGDQDYPYVLARRISDLEELLSHLGTKQNLTLFLHDWGGLIGMGYATRHPESVDRLVVFNSFGFLLPEGKTLPWPIAICRVPILGPLLVRGLGLFSYIATLLYVRGDRSDRGASRILFRAPYDSWKNRLAIQRFIDDIPIRARDASYSLVKATDDNLYRLKDRATLICWGDGDFVFDQRILDEWKRRFPDAEIHQLSHGGHYVTENATSRVDELTKAFLQTHPIRASR